MFAMERKCFRMKFKYKNICSDGLEITKMRIIARIEKECPEILFSNLKPGQRRTMPWCCSRIKAVLLS